MAYWFLEVVPSTSRYFFRLFTTSLPPAPTRTETPTALNGLMVHNGLKVWVGLQRLRSDGQPCAARMPTRSGVDAVQLACCLARLQVSRLHALQVLHAHMDLRNLQLWKTSPGPGDKGKTSNTKTVLSRVSMPRQEKEPPGSGCFSRRLGGRRR